MDKLKQSMLEIGLGAAVTTGGLLAGIVYSNEAYSQSPTVQSLNHKVENCAYLAGMGGLILTVAGFKELSKSD